MSEHRATKSGIARDVQQKIAGKYDKEIAAKCMVWLAEKTGETLNTSGDMDSVCEQLKDGYVLCLLVSKIKQGCIPASKLKRTPMSFKQMELLEMFTTKIKEMGIPEYSVFATTDLFEKQNMVQVITCIESVARKCNSIPGCPVQGFGPKEAEANKREFTAEQLAEGKNIIGLQMGSNKGANQSGQNFGKGRMIVD
eukprot:TRINITY_DN27192_c0_g1_i1.p1 TRINITY_DN27192_c0_g1~~TRINITY_DN27192_c0_g1_i1.p1  ORF type:complete len:196 (-),score=64.79 TRINITY_DN27192_c0_g1_i1:460-1047(-)